MTMRIRLVPFNRTLMLCLLIAAVAVLIPQFGLVIPRADGHDAKHSAEKVTTDTIRAAIKAQTCTRVERYLSTAKNKVLILCAFGFTQLIGGLIIGATTHNEITAFAAPRDYWEKVIARDGYQPLP